MLATLRKAGNTHFVRQRFARGDVAAEGLAAKGYLFTHYTCAQLAQSHIEAMGSADPHAFVYDIEVPEHAVRLSRAARGIAGYRFFSPVLSKAWEPGWDIEVKIRKYIRTKLPWRPAWGEHVRSDVFVRFGEIFITLKFKGQQVSIPVSDIDF